MASDLKIEIFAYDMFSRLFMTLGEDKSCIFQIYGDECYKSNSYMEVCDVLFYEAVLCRFIVFKTIYLKDLTDERIKNLKSLSDCYDYVIQVCDRNDLFGHLTVFEKMLTTSAFVITLCVLIYFDTTSVIDVVSYGHLFWAMYFDKFIEEFYKEGGWTELKKVSRSYFALAWFLDILIESKSINSMKEASVNYHKFKKISSFHEYKHVSNQWAKFHIDNLENYIVVPLSYQYSINSYEADLLLEDLKRLCDPKSESFEKCENFESFETININGGCNLPIENLFPEKKSKICDTYRSELSKNQIKSENEIESEYSASKMELFPLNISVKNVNLKSRRKTFFETDLEKSGNIYLAAHSQTDRLVSFVETISRQTGAKIGNLSELIDLNSDPIFENMSLNIKNELFPTKNFSKSLEGQNNITSGLVLSKQDENISSNNNCCSKCLNSAKKYANTTSGRMDVNTNIDAFTSETSSVDQMVTFERNKDTVPGLDLSQKCFNSSNHLVKTIDKIQNSREDMDDLRQQNNDSGICDLRRMILILGDRSGIEYVRSTLHNSKGSGENLTKLKKRSKKNKKRAGN